jgi:hypothetical protein
VARIVFSNIPGEVASYSEDLDGADLLTQNVRNDHSTNRSASTGIHVTDTGLHRSNTAGGMQPVSGTERVQLVDHGKSVMVGGHRTSEAAALVLARQAPELDNELVAKPTPAQPTTPAADQATSIREALQAEADAAKALHEEQNKIENTFGEAIVQKVTALDAGLVQSTLLAVASGDETTIARNLRSAGDALGIKEADAGAYMQIVMNELGAQVNRYAASRGIQDVNAFNAFASKLPENRSINAMGSHLRTRNVAQAWGDIATAYKARGGK